MGENIPVVRQIIHISAPCTLESYYEEIGRTRAAERLAAARGKFFLGAPIYNFLGKKNFRTSTLQLL
jgi:superfamily II DNA/RNA helicase